jgi:hypothetical protein
LDHNTTTSMTTTPQENDVLYGRGLSIVLRRPGNQKYRSFVISAKPAYDTATTKVLKGSLARSIVDMVHSLDPPGRYLKKNQASGDWEEVTDEEATQRAWQALRDARVTQPSSSRLPNLVNNLEEQEGDSMSVLARLKPPDKGEFARFLAQENVRLRNELSEMETRMRVLTHEQHTASSRGNFNGEVIMIVEEDLEDDEELLEESEQDLHFQLT